MHEKRPLRTRLPYEAFLLERFEDHDLWFVAVSPAHKHKFIADLDEDARAAWAFAVLAGEKLQYEFMVKQVLEAKGIPADRIELIDAGELGRLPFGQEMYVKVLR